MSEKSIQDRYAPDNACFGCGPANAKGLRIKSYPIDKDSTWCEWGPEAHHEAFPGVVNGGIIGALLDCHSNWCAGWHLMHRRGEDAPPCTVTADYAVKLHRATPSKGPVRLTAKAVESSDRKVIVEASLSVDGELCASCRGTFVAVKEDHPAFHRWREHYP